MKIIITDANSRKAFDIIQILKRVYHLDLLLFSSSGFKVQLPLIYGQNVHRLRCHRYRDFKEDLFPVLKRYQDEMLIYLPLSEEFTLRFYQFIKEDIPFNLTWLLPDREIFDLTRNKKKFQRYCENNDIPVPDSYNKENLHVLSDDFHPVIAKRTIGAGSIGMKYIDEAQQLSVLDELDHNSYLIQEKINSNRNIHGAFYLCKNGVVHTYHGHRRIRTFPEKGGVTVFSKADYNEELKNIGAALLEKLNWNGFAMIEFMYDQSSDSWKIIELNPRLWGSIMLSEFCGSSLLINYIKLCQNEPLIKNPPETDRYIRWIFPFDVISLLKGKIVMREFLNLKRNKTCYINFTYSSWYSATLFLFYFTFNTRSIKRFIKKIFS